MKFRSKTTFVDAVQFTEAMAKGDHPLPEGVVLMRRELGPPPERRIIFQKHILSRAAGDVKVAIGDWIVTYANGRRECWSPTCFERDYEPIELRIGSEKEKLL